jgi:hypothetical protein
MYAEGPGPPAALAGDMTEQWATFSTPGPEQQNNVQSLRRGPLSTGISLPSFWEAYWWFSSTFEDLWSFEKILIGYKKTPPGGKGISFDSCHSVESISLVY